MGDFMDSGAHCLHLAHSGANGDTLVGQAEEAVRIPANGLDLHGDRRGPAQSLHENLILLDAAVEIADKLRQRFSLRLRHIEHGHHLEQGNLDFFFLHDGIAVPVQHRSLGVRVQLDLFHLLLEGRGRDDLDALFALFHIPAELVTPLVETGHQRGVGALHMYEHDIVQGVAVEPAHGGKIPPVLIAVEQLPDALLNTIGDFFQPVLVALFFSHGKLLVL